MTPPTSLLGIALAIALVGCQPKIGDSCHLSTDCSQTSANRTCDTTLSSAGYCTIFNCEPNTCPSEAVCVAYDSSNSVAPGCRTDLSGSRLERTWCMRHCSKDSDCRTGNGFRCVSVDKDNPWGAVVVDRGSKVPKKICAIPYSGEVIPEGRSTGVCSGTSDEPLPGPLPASTSPDAGRMPGDAAVDSASPPSDASAIDASSVASDAAFRDAARDVRTDGSP